MYVLPINYVDVPQVKKKCKLAKSGAEIKNQAQRKYKTNMKNIITERNITGIYIFYYIQPSIS